VCEAILMVRFDYFGECREAVVGFYPNVKCRQTNRYLAISASEDLISPNKKIQQALSSHIKKRTPYKRRSALYHLINKTKHQGFQRTINHNNKYRF
jgi:hypothetical protein